jgi:hypothetical protein
VNIVEFEGGVMSETLRNREAGVPKYITRAGGWRLWASLKIQEWGWRVGFALFSVE